MASRTIYKCDRCGKEWEYVIKNGFGNSPRHVDYEPYRRIDLCDDCYNEFYEKVAEWKKNLEEVDNEI